MTRRRPPRTLAAIPDVDLEPDDDVIGRVVSMPVDDDPDQPETIAESLALLDLGLGAGFDYLVGQLAELPSEDDSLHDFVNVRDFVERHLRALAEIHTLVTERCVGILERPVDGAA